MVWESLKQGREDPERPFMGRKDPGLGMDLGLGLGLGEERERRLWGVMVFTVAISLCVEGRNEAG